MISNIGNSTRHVSNLNSEGKAIKPNNLKLVKIMPALSNLKFRLAGSGGDSRTGVPPMNSIVGLAGVTDFLHQPFSR